METENDRDAAAAAAAAGARCIVETSAFLAETEQMDCTTRASKSTPGNNKAV
jgi:hypothetical protein